MMKLKNIHIVDVDGGSSGGAEKNWGGTIFFVVEWQNILEWGGKNLGEDNVPVDTKKVVT